MDFITIKNCRLGDEGYPEIINVEHVVSIEPSRINLSNGKYVITTREATEKLAEYLRKKGHNIARIGE